MLKNVGKFLTSEYVIGASAGLLIGLLILFNNPEGSVWNEIKQSQTLIAGFFAITGGYYLWDAKQKQIEHQKEIENSYDQKFRAKFLSELYSLLQRAEMILETYREGTWRLEFIDHLGLFRALKIYSEERPEYLNHLNERNIKELALLEAKIDAANSHLSFRKHMVALHPDEKFGMEVIEEREERKGKETFEMAFEELIEGISSAGNAIDSNLWTEINKLNLHYIM